MENDYERLVRICRKDFTERQKALLDEIASRNPLVLDDGTIVLESRVANPVALVAHYDNVNGSYGYNDNGMSIVAILGMLDALPANVEVVFTNGEERCSIGARNYLESRTEKPIGCVNLDVCGYGDTIYLDRMNCKCSDVVEAVTGSMPWNDGRVFKDNGIPSVCVSTSRGTDFNNGIREIWRTIHNNSLDNRLDVLNFGLLPKVRDTVGTLVESMS